jgi:predicted dehydrogenase
MRVLVVGLGKMGSFHTRRLPDAVAWLESSPRSATGRTMFVGTVDPALHGHYATLEDALKLHWDAAIVATPIPSLADTTLELVAAGIPTLVEKPGALTELEALEVDSAAAAAGVLVSVGWIERHNLATIGLQARLPLVGQVQRIESIRTGPTGGMDPAIDLAVHDLDLARSLGLTDVEHTAIAKYDEHVKERRFTVHGSDATLTADLRLGKLSLWHRGVESDPFPEIASGIQMIGGATITDPLTLELARFIQTIEAAGEPEAPMSGAAQVIRAAYELVA